MEYLQHVLKILFYKMCFSSSTHVYLFSNLFISVWAHGYWLYLGILIQYHLFVWLLKLFHLITDVLSFCYNIPSVGFLLVCLWPLLFATGLPSAWGWLALNICILDGRWRDGRGRKKDRRKRKERLSHSLLRTLRAEIKPLERACLKPYMTLWQLSSYTRNRK